MNTWTENDYVNDAMVKIALLKDTLNKAEQTTFTAEDLQAFKLPNGDRIPYRKSILRLALMKLVEQGMLVEHNYWSTSFTFKSDVQA